MGQKPIRIYRRVCRKKWKAGRVYKYVRVYLPIPSRFRDVVAPFVGKDLQIDVRREGDSLLISAALASEEPP